MRVPREMKSVRINGDDFYYTDAGAGEPVVFVHGSLSDYRTWRLQIKFFSKSYHTIAYSRRYHYPNVTSGDGSDYSASLHAEDLAEFIKTLRLGAVHLIGSSYGAYTSLIMAVKYPESVRSLVIGEPPIFPLLKDDPEGRPFLRDFLDTVWEPSKQAFQSGNEELGVKLFMDGITGPDSLNKLSPGARAGLMQNAPSMRMEITGRNHFPSFTEQDARRIKAPCLLLTGEQSPKIFYRITEILHKWLPRAERAVIPVASHAMHSQNPQAYNETVLTFLQGIK